MAIDSTNESLIVEKPAPNPRTPKANKNSEDEIREVAQKLADQPVQNSDTSAWGILTAISKLSRKRVQGMHIILTMDEHTFGRCVEDTRYRIELLSVSSKHCMILKEKTAADGELDSNKSVSVFIKDTSTNGTFLNWKKLHSAKARLQHGDIISFIHPPHHANAYAFVYREVSKSPGSTNGAVMKRKSEDFCSESKRHKGIGIGAPDGPISLDDVRSLQRSNTELRQQLESHVHTIEMMRSENRATITHHENELKDLKEKVSNSYLDQIKDLHQSLDEKQKQIDETSSSLAESRHLIDDLNERLQLSNQSRADADDIIQSQKATISELEAQLHEERNMRREERENAETDLKSALQKAHSEAQEEIKRQADVYMRQHKEQQEVIIKLQESEKEYRTLVETLRSKVDDARENLVISEKKVRQLEVQVQDEQVASANSKKRSEALEAEVRRLAKELESEKVAREEAWAKVSSLELEIASAIRDLSMEKQRFQGARERIILRETQLRAFYSTTEEISSLFTKQQEQLKAMQKTLEDEENYANTLLGVDLNDTVTPAVNAVYLKVRDNLKVRDEAHPTINNSQETSGTSTPRNNENATREGSDDGSTTEKHNPDENTQDLDCTTSDMFAKGTEVVPGPEHTDTERVMCTESQYGDERTFPVLQKCSTAIIGGDTMQIDDEGQIEEDGDPTNEIRTGDLLASEVPGSWAVETAPSGIGENELPNDNVNNSNAEADADAADALLLFSEGHSSGSQSNVPCSVGSKMSDEHKALNAMIEIVAPEFKQQFLNGGDDAETQGDDPNADDSDSDSDDDDNGDVDDTDDGNSVGNDVTIEDSLG